MGFEPLMEPDFTQISVSLLGGLALFLLGMNLMTQALNGLAGDRMKALLASFTRNRFSAALSGAAVTAAVQSSSVTTVLLVGFTSVGLMTVSQSVGVIFGANVGSTVTAQLIAFRITEAAAPLLAIGLFVSFFKKAPRLSLVGTFILGLGAIFFGMGEMSEATQPLRTYPPFIDAMQTFDAPWAGLLVGFVFTAVVQSSAATIGLVIILGDQGFIGLPAAIAIAFGANIGTCVTAFLAAIGRPAPAWRVAFIHTLFNVSGVAIWYLFIPYLGLASQWLTSLTTGGGEGLARQIAYAHTLFNLANLLLFIPFTGPVAKLAFLAIREREREVPPQSVPIYLDTLYLKTPSMAIDRARLEAGRLAAFALQMAEEIPIAALRGSRGDIERLATLDDQLDELQTAILNYLARIDGSQLSAAEKQAMRHAIALVNAWENIGDALDNDVLDLGRNRLDAGLPVSDQTYQAIAKLHQELLGLLRLAMVATGNSDASAARKALKGSPKFERLADQTESELLDRLAGRQEERMELFRLEADLINNLKRIHYFVRRIASITLGEE